MKIKKLSIFMLALVCVSALLFTGCITAMLLSSSISIEQDFRKSLKETPADSVLVYGNCPVAVSFFQADTTKNPNMLWFVITDGILVSKPVQPGSRYKALWASETIGRVIQHTFFGLNGQTPIDFSVPKTPGLFYIGTYEGSFAYGKFSKKEFTDKKKEAAAELKALKTVRRLCAKTEWEPVVKARIEELQNAK